LAEHNKYLILFVKRITWSPRAYMQFHNHDRQLVSLYSIQNLYSIQKAHHIVASGLHAVPQPRPPACLPLLDPKMSCSWRERLTGVPQTWQHKCSKNAAQMQHKCSTNAAQMQHKCSQKAAKMSCS
jgi:hypothetical protein